MKIRKANECDIDKISAIFCEVHTEEEQGRATTGWIRGVYPTENTARTALHRDDLFVLEDNGEVLGTAIINQIQMESYEKGTWKYKAFDEDVMVLHTLVISPKASGKGYGKRFVAYYEEYALSMGCHYLRMDTNEKNKAARALYKRLGYDEVGIVECDFNGIERIHLVLLEKYLP